MDESGHSLLQESNIELRPSTNDTMSVSNQSAAAPTTGLNGNAQARKCLENADGHLDLTVRSIWI
jgi:hypothetical protein